MDLRDMAKAAFTLPWAIALFGAQQGARLVWPSGREGVADSGHAFDTLAATAAAHLDGWAHDAYQVGDALQSAAVDLAMLRPPDVDPRRLTPLGAATTSTPLVETLLAYGLPPVGRVDALLTHRADTAAVGAEFRNKLAVLLLAARSRATLRLRTGEPIDAQVARTVEVATFPRLWALEAIGFHATGDRLAAALAPQPDLLRGTGRSALPRWSLGMLHTGMGLAFADAALRPLASAAPLETVGDAVHTFVALCRESSLAGYEYAALASLGVVARTRYPERLSELDAAVRAVDADGDCWFWHGVGRGAYFDPRHLLPSASAPWRGLTELEADIPREPARHAALAGFVWMLTAVNLTNPEVMEALFRHHDCTGPMAGPWTTGAVSSLLVRYDTTRDEPAVAPFVRHVPADAELALVWRDRLTVPFEAALQGPYPHLRDRHRLGDLFAHRPLL